MIDRAGAEALDAADDLGRFRERFVLRDADLIYLDGNSLGPLPVTTPGRLAAQVDEWGDRLVEGWEDWVDLPVRVGDRLGQAVLGAGPGQVLVGDSTTVNLYKLASAAVVARPGRTTIVGDAHDFPTDRYVLQGIAAAHGLELRLLRSDPVAGPSVAELAGAVDEATALVCLSHVNFRSAARLDLARLAELAHRVGALVLCDLSHSAGAVPLALDDDGVDLAVGCTYKYLNAGPGAPALLYVRRELQDDLCSPIWGWFGQRDQFAMGEGYQPSPGIRRFAAGTPPVLGLAGVGAGVELCAEAGMQRLWARSAGLTSLLIDLFDAWLAPLGCRLASPRALAARGGHVAIGHPDAWRVCRALIERCAVRPDFRPPDVIRLCPAPLFTRSVEVWDACDRLRRLLDSGEYLGVDAGARRIT
jgi:kynureninase